MTKDKNAKSVIALFNEMTKALEEGCDNYHWLISKCRTQSSLSLIERASDNIHPMTLNTFKKYSNLYIDGGFESINKIRIQLKTKRPNSLPAKKKQRQEEKVIDIQSKLEEAERMRAVLLRAYNELNKITLDALVNSPQCQNDYQKHKKLYASYFGLNLVKNK
ncbi:hypothetical protein NX722_18255 [Endozoicomonas gorgoniicola]|uniref:Uncharacterized protein n=1 Tax=Endozoicomonas gorgoniicola TaxID=1234144 RepID=A0ABT3MYT3_9GAMM|nr:hypothetical protein [Endozoicomonas gorgoniicola]MCW7554530.1 hypothetical protein [Endozoicomonas gorgoniicola]